MSFQEMKPSEFRRPTTLNFKIRARILPIRWRGNPLHFLARLRWLVDHFFEGSEIVDFWGLGGPGSLGDSLKGWGASPPTCLKSLEGSRGRPDLQNRRSRILQNTGPLTRHCPSPTPVGRRGFFSVRGAKARATYNCSGCGCGIVAELKLLF